MVYLTAINRLAKQLGATISRTEEYRFAKVYADSPKGKVWQANCCHCLMAEWYVGDTKYKTDSLTDMLERMEMGLCDCDIEDCDVCGRIEKDLS